MFVHFTHTDFSSHCSTKNKSKVKTERTSFLETLTDSEKYYKMRQNMITPDVPHLKSVTSMKNFLYEDPVLTLQKLFSTSFVITTIESEHPGKVSYNFVRIRRSGQVNRFLRPRVFHVHQMILVCVESHLDSDLRPVFPIE